MSENKLPKDGRTRNWAFIVYPDSAPENWQDILSEECVPAFISPLHDRDANPDGEPKKPHWHVVLMFRGKKSQKQVQEISDKLSGVKPEPVKDIRGYARYLIHADNPEKYQYPAADVVSLCGADWITSTESMADTDTAVGQMMEWCEVNQCYSFAALSKYARNNRPDWFRVLTSKRTNFMVAYVKSLRWEIMQDERYDEELTGENKGEGTA